MIIIIKKIVCKYLRFSYSRRINEQRNIAFNNIFSRRGYFFAYKQWSYTVCKEIIFQMQIYITYMIFYF